MPRKPTTNSCVNGGSQVRDLIAADVNRKSRPDRGREGLDYRQVLVLAAVRLGCNLDYDQLQDLAEQHRTLLQIMGLGDWEEEASFKLRRIQDNRSLPRPERITAVRHTLIAKRHSRVT